MNKIEPSQTLSETQSDKDLEISPSTAPTQRKVKPYLWKPGQSGNPEGRPKGSKNKITAQKLGIEEHLRDQLNLYMPEILQAAIEKALKGDSSMQKVLIELCMSKAVAVEDATDGKSKVTVNLRNLTIEAKPEDITKETQENVTEEASNGRQLQ
jgi:hypothetical protein